MPSLTKMYARQLERMLSDGAELFGSLFDNDRISQREQEWLTFDSEMRTTLERSTLLQHRLETIKQICSMSWQEPWHITGSMPKYRNFDTIQDAIDAYPKAYYDYTTRLQKYSIGNLVVQVEIGFNLIEGELKFNLHFHALMEKVGYTYFISKTEHYRRGRKPNSWEFYTKHNPRCTTGKYQEQTLQDYIFAQARYLTKFSILQGDTRKSETGNASKAMPNQREFAEKLLELKLDHPVLVRRIVVSSKFAASELYSWLRERINRLRTLINTLKLFTKLFEGFITGHVPGAGKKLLKLAKCALGLLHGLHAPRIIPKRSLTAEEAFIMDAFSD